MVSPMATSPRSTSPEPAPLAIWQMEAEDGTRAGGMRVGTDNGASKCGYVYDTVPFSGGTVRFDASVPYAGDYAWARVMGTDWNNNSFFVKVDGGPIFHYEVGQFGGQWTWGWIRSTRTTFRSWSSPSVPERIRSSSALARRRRGLTWCSWSIARTMCLPTSGCAARHLHRHQPDSDGDALTYLDAHTHPDADVDRNADSNANSHRNDNSNGLPTPPSLQETPLLP